ncbi:MAG: dihydroorotate dehydrogenase electron transfer subunit [Chloroflexota bacterium]|nr:dihydroorotate dehydrogenase electron transfer subunit [Chloroflexota bacterium]
MVSVREFCSEVVAVEPVMGDAVLLTFLAPKELVRSLKAGVFFEILCRTDGSCDPLLRRPYSIFRANPDEGTLTILVRPFGRGSGWLAQRQIGSELNILGPLGNAYTVSPRTRHGLLVSGGVGVAPMVMLADEAVAAGVSVTFLMGAATNEGLLSASLLPREVEYVVATEDGSGGYLGYVTEVVPEYVPWADQVFACGPESMYRSLRNAAEPHRVQRRPAIQVSMERTMACGVGACLGCVVKTRHGMKTSCVDGPVFDLDEVAW